MCSSTSPVRVALVVRSHDEHVVPGGHLHPPGSTPGRGGADAGRQYALELKLLLRNGEQLLLTMFIPITLLIGLTLLPLGPFGEQRDHRVAVFVPAIMALAVISTAFTGQTIAVAFDRRYGALKRLGATALPVWGIIAGKALAVVSGFPAGGAARRDRQPRLAARSGRPAAGCGDHRVGHRGVRGDGTAARRDVAAEIVLAVANLLWFVFAGIGALTLRPASCPPRCPGWPG